jgi:diadenosine tetraphosphate (Ap4A) HIT family hydrolase
LRQGKAAGAQKEKFVPDLLRFVMRLSDARAHYFHLSFHLLSSNQGKMLN